MSRKTGPRAGYPAQYRLADDGTRALRPTLVRRFGTRSGHQETEPVAVDNELGFTHYSDEGVGVRKYYAGPARGSQELALFAKTSFTEGHASISIYSTGPQRVTFWCRTRGPASSAAFPARAPPSAPTPTRTACS